MGSINSDEIISILRSEIEDWDVHARDQEVGTVIESVTESRHLWN